MVRLDHVAGRRGVGVLLLVAALAAGAGGVARGGVVTLTAGFKQYTGAVGNGTGIAGDRQYQSLMQGNNIAPSAPIPGLEDLFIPPDPTDPNSVGQGIGMGTVNLDGSGTVDFSTTVFNPDDGLTTYGIPNLIEFAAGPAANVAVGEEFLLGTFAIQNGEWWAASPLHYFTFEITTHSLDPLLDGHVFSDTLVLNITPNGGPPEVRADIYYFLNHPELGAMRVLEQFDGDNFGTAQLFGKIGSLIPTRFGNPTGGLFLTPSTGPLPPQGVVPEPGTWVLLASGLFAVAGYRRVARR